MDESKWNKITFPTLALTKAELPHPVAVHFQRVYLGMVTDWFTNVSS